MRGRADGVPDRRETACSLTIEEGDEHDTARRTEHREVRQRAEVVSKRAPESRWRASSAEWSNLGLKPEGCRVFKLPRANGGCLGAERRRRTWIPAKSHGELVSEHRSVDLRMGKPAPGNAGQGALNP